EREEVVRRLDCAIADDVEVAREGEPERLVERAAAPGIGDPHHRVQETRHLAIVAPLAPPAPQSTFARAYSTASSRVIELPRANSGDVLSPSSKSSRWRAYLIRSVSCSCSPDASSNEQTQPHRRAATSRRPRLAPTAASPASEYAL